MPFILSNCNIYLSKGVNILLGQPVYSNILSTTVFGKLYVVEFLNGTKQNYNNVTKIS